MDKRTKYSDKTMYILFLRRTDKIIFGGYSAPKTTLCYSLYTLSSGLFSFTPLINCGFGAYFAAKSLIIIFNN